MMFEGYLDHNYQKFLNYLIQLTQKSNINGIKIWQFGGSNVVKAFEVLSTGFHKIKIQSLILQGNFINDKVIAILAKGLEQNKTLNHLNLSTNELGNEGVKILANILPNTTITQLYLGNNKIKVPTAIAQIIKSTSILTHLDLADNLATQDIGGAALSIAQALAKNNSLVYLGLQKCSVKDRGVEAIVDSLSVNKKLSEIDLTENQITWKGGEKLADMLVKNTVITKLLIGKNVLQKKVGAKFGEALRNNTHLLHLNLANCDIGSAVELADSLKVNKTLACLNIEGNKIIDAFAVKLAEALLVNNTLCELNMSNNALGNDAAVLLAKALAVNYGLKLLDVNTCTIGAIGGVAIADALAQNTSLSTLILANNDITEAGGMHLTKSLAGNKSLTLLNLGNWYDSTNIGQAGLAKLIDATKTNVNLKIIYNERTYDDYRYNMTDVH